MTYSFIILVLVLNITSCGGGVGGAGGGGSNVTYLICMNSQENIKIKPNSFDILEIKDPPSHGEFRFDGEGALYTPYGEYIGNDSLTYISTNSNSGVVNTKTINVRVESCDLKVTWEKNTDEYAQWYAIYLDDGSGYKELEQTYYGTEYIYKASSRGSYRFAVEAINDVGKSRRSLVHIILNKKEYSENKSNSVSVKSI